MKKNLSTRLFVFPLLGLGGLLLATSCATVGSTTKTVPAGTASAPAYYNGNNEPVASGAYVYAEEN
jgi:hypothetical protein